MSVKSESASVAKQNGTTSKPSSSSSSQPKSSSSSRRKSVKSTKAVKKVRTLSDSDDTDLEYDENAFIHRKQKDRSDCQCMYEAACRHYDVIASSQFINQMKSSRVQMTDLSIKALDVKAMCIPLLYNTCVSVLDLSGNRMSNKGAVHVMDMLKENVLITQLSLARNGISKSGARYICTALHTHPRLTKLDLSGNLLRDNSAHFFAELLKSNSIMRSLDLSGNHFGEESGVILSSAVAENGALEELDLSWNHIRLQGAVALAKSLKDNDNLKRLDVSWNGFTNEGAAEMGRALSENFTLKELNMNCNRINLVGLSHLAKGIDANEGLNTLKLSGNPILSIGAEMILQVIRHNEHSKVTKLDINDIPVSYNFAATLEEMQQKNTELNVKHDCRIRHSNDLMQQPGCLSSADPHRILCMWVKERTINMADVLVTCVETENMIIDEAPFKAAIRKITAPLTETQLSELTRKLHRYDDKNRFVGLDISSFVNEEEYREKRNAYLADLDARRKAEQIELEAQMAEEQGDPAPELLAAELTQARTELVEIPSEQSYKSSKPCSGKTRSDYDDEKVETLVEQDHKTPEPKEEELGD